MYRKMKKKELINLLVDKYGYAENDLKKNDGQWLTNPALRTIIEEEMSDEKNYKDKEQIKEKARREFKDDDLIDIMNGTKGELVHRSQRTGRMWVFRDFGIVQRMPYSEVVDLYNNNHKVFTNATLIILNKQLQEDFDLSNVYRNVLTPQNIKKIFKEDTDKMKKIVDSMPEASKIVFINTAKEMYKSGSIDSMSKIKFIESEFNLSLDDGTPLGDFVKGG